jgi:hypothetical protein
MTVTASGCSRTAEVVSTADDTTTVDATIAATTTTVIDTTTATTIVPETTTTELETTTTVETTTTEPPATSTTVAGPAPTPPAIAYVAADTDLLEIATADSAVTRTVVEFFNGDGVFRGNLRLAPDGATIWFSEGYEDSWYGCDTSVGSFGRVDVASGAVEILGTGWGAEPSPDGAQVAYLDSDLCLPDPEAPEFWVLTPYDRVVIRDLAAGTEQEIVTDPAPADAVAPSQITWVGYTTDGELLVLTADRQLRLVDPAGSGVLQDHPVVLPELRGLPAGTTDGALITADRGDEGSTDVYAIDPSSGGATLLASSEGFVSVGVAPSGAVVVAGFSDVTVEPGAPVTVLTAPEGSTYFDVDW